MRIGIDAREICGHATGAGRYLSGLLHQWAAGDGLRRHELILYAPERLDVEPDSRGLAVRVIAGGAGTWWEQVQLPRATATDHLDVFFAPAYTAPLRLRVPTVVAIHDVSFVAHPEWFRMREGIRRRLLTRQSATRARAVVTISEFSRRELIDRLGVPAARVHVIPPGVSAADVSGRAARRPRAVRRFDLQPPPPARSRPCVWHPRPPASAGVARSGGRQPNASV